MINAAASCLKSAEKCRETHTRNRKIRSRPLPCCRVLYPLIQIREVFIDVSLLLFRVSFSSWAVIDGKDAGAEIPWCGGSCCYFFRCEARIPTSRQRIAACGRPSAKHHSRPWLVEANPFELLCARNLVMALLASDASFTNDRLCELQSVLLRSDACDVDKAHMKRMGSQICDRAYWLTAIMGINCSEGEYVRFVVQPYTLGEPEGQIG
jgi:hypothetical protein